jgi:hypothetical protein
VLLGRGWDFDLAGRAVTPSVSRHSPRHRLDATVMQRSLFELAP